MEASVLAADGPPPFSLHAFGASSPHPTAAVATAHFVVLGNAEGALLVHDVFGNHVSTDCTRHSTAITALAANDRADVLASSSSSCNLIATRLGGDGTVPLSKAPTLLRTRSASPITHLRVDPYFGRARAGNRIAWVEQSGAVRSFSPGWLVDDRRELKPPGSPSVRALTWSANLLAFALSDSVHVFDMRTVTPVCVVSAPHARLQSPTDITSTSTPIPPDPLPPIIPPTPPSPLSDADSAVEPVAETNIDFEDIDARRAAAAAALLSTGGARARFVQGTPPPPTASPSENSPNQDSLIARWTQSVSLFMEEEEVVIGSDTAGTPIESATLLHVTWPLCSRTLRIGPHRPGAQYAGNPRQVSITFRLERGDLPSSLPGTLGVASNEAEASEWAEANNPFGTMTGTGAGDFPRPITDLLLTPLLCALPFGDSDRIVLVGTAWHSLALHLVDQAGRCIRSMALPHTGLKHADMLIIPGGDPLVLILSHLIDGMDSDLKRENSVNTVESDHMRLADTNVTLASALTVAEQVKWHLANNRFSDALAIAQTAPGGSLRRAEVSVSSIGDQFLESIRSLRDFDRLATVLPNTISSTSPDMGMRSREKVMKTRKKRWEYWISVFRKADKLAIVAPSIPTYEPRFEPAIYDNVLLELAERKPIAMHSVLQTWPADVFNLTAVTRKVEKQLDKLQREPESLGEEEKDALRESLLMLYGLSGRHDETLNLLLKDRSPRVFEYIKSHHLYEAVRSRNTILGLFRIDEHLTTDLLVHAPETVLPPDAVVPILEDISNTKWMYLYLHGIFKVDSDRAAGYHNLLLRLYVDHDEKGHLFTFLKTSNHYSLDTALQALNGARGAKKGVFAKERVFVLAAMGDTNSALDILLDELDDIPGAIEFASENGDDVLWERLINHASTNADTLAALLDSPAGGKVDPVRLIPLLNSEMHIPFLRDRLHRILVDAALERALREDATAALRFDAQHLLNALDDALTIPPARV